MGPSPHPPRPRPSTCWETATSRECSPRTAAMATCPLSGRSPRSTTWLTVAAKESSSKGVSPSEWTAWPPGGPPMIGSRPVAHLLRTGSCPGSPGQCRLAGLFPTLFLFHSRLRQEVPPFRRGGRYLGYFWVLRRTQTGKSRVWRGEEDIPRVTDARGERRSV